MSASRWAFLIFVTWHFSDSDIPDLDCCSSKRWISFFVALHGVWKSSHSDSQNILEQIISPATDRILTHLITPYRSPNSRMPPSYHQDTTKSHLQQRTHHNSPHTTLTRPLTNPDLAPLKKTTHKIEA
jgi:hypothetical protein